MTHKHRMNYRNIDVLQSNRIADRLSSTGDSARRRRGSGSAWQAKGDVLSRMFLVEAKDKAAPAKQRTIHREVFDKLKLEAIQENKIPLYVVGFGDGRDFYILEDIDFTELLRRLHEAEESLVSLKEDHDTMEQALVTKTGECQVLEEEISVLADKLIDSEEKIDDLENENYDLLHKVDQMENDIYSLENDVNELESQLNDKD